MSASANPDIVDDGLVFLYDTDDGKSYKGEPTTNLISGVANPNLSISGWYSNGWNGSISVDTDEGALVLNATNGWRSMSYDFGVTNGTVTVQFDYKLKSAEHTNIYMVVLNGTHLGSYTQYLDGSLYPSLTEYKTYKKTFTTTTDSKICIVLRGTDNAGLTDEMFIKNLQVEQKSHATPFVNGTRSTTQGLLDRTRNSTIDLASMSYNSNAQKSFDGTDDYMTISDPNVSSSDGFSIEIVTKPENISSAPVIITPNNEGIDHFARFNSNGSVYFRMVVAADSTTQDFATTTQLTSGNYHYVVFTFRQSDGGKVYYNGELESSAAANFTAKDWSNIWRIGQRGNGSWYYQGELPILKVYNRALTSTEVLQNFNATKSRFGI